jgi:hypothetical protein
MSLIIVSSKSIYVPIKLQSCRIGFGCFVDSFSDALDAEDLADWKSVRIGDVLVGIGPRDVRLWSIEGVEAHLKKLWECSPAVIFYFSRLCPPMNLHQMLRWHQTQKILEEGLIVSHSSLGNSYAKFTHLRKRFFLCQCRIMSEFFKDYFYFGSTVERYVLSFLRTCALSNVWNDFPVDISRRIADLPSISHAFNSNDFTVEVASILTNTVAWIENDIYGSFFDQYRKSLAAVRAWAWLSYTPLINTLSVRDIVCNAASLYALYLFLTQSGRLG